MELLTLKELAARHYPMEWVKEIAHSTDFEEAGGIRRPVRSSKIYFNVDQLDRYLANHTRRYL